VFEDTGFVSENEDEIVSFHTSKPEKNDAL